jgi:hypothetical protein
MADQLPGASSPVYDRALLLGGSKRNQILDLGEIQRYGADSFADPDYLCIYGLKPAGWYARGVRLLGRTAVECTRDSFAERIGRTIAGTAAKAPTSGSVVIDPFAGSGNTLYWTLRFLPGANGMGFELDNAVFALSSRNLAIIHAPIELRQQDYRAGLRSLVLPTDQLLVVFVAPPWGDALDERAGLDLRHTSPPVPDILDHITESFPANRLLYAIQVYETLEPQGLAAAKQRCDWSALSVFDLGLPGRNHGILLGTRGWTP